MTVYITKYALTRGIEVLECVRDINKPKYFYYEHATPFHLSELYVLDVDCFLTWESAIANAELRRDKKIASLSKQIKKLEKLTFSVKSHAMGVGS